MTVKKNILCLSFLFFLFNFFSQKSNIDSLYQVAKEHPNDTIGMRAYLGISNYYMSKGLIDTAWISIKKGYDAAKRINYKRGIAASANHVAQYYNYHGNQDSSVFYFTKAKDLYSELGDSSRMSGMLNNIGVAYKSHGNVSKALDFYFMALRIKERLHDTEGMASSYTNLGHLFQDARDTANTIKYYMKGLDLRKKMNDKWGVSNSYMALGLFYQTYDQFNKSLTYLKTALTMAEELGDEEMIAIGSYNLANVYQRQKKLDLCIPLYERSLALSKKNNNSEGIATCLETLGEIAFEQNNVKKAIPMFEEGYEKAVEIDNKELVQNIANKLSIAYESVGDYKRSLAFHKIWTTVKDSIYNQANTRKLTSETLKFEYEKEKILVQKEQEKKESLAKSEAFKKDLILIASVLFLIVVSCFSVIIFKRLKENKKQKDIIEQQRNEMIDSINYAKRIQFALLAHADFLKNNLPEHFIFFKPKDIVSGDFYWATQKNGFFYLAVCDSTGHGVPGAFMSLLNISFLNEAINEKNILAPNEVLNHVRKRLLENMSEGRDGMDAAIIKIPLTGNTLNVEYAAANNSPILIRNTEVIQLAKDKMPVGKGELTDDFKLHTIELEKGDLLYLYTDGFADQFGGPKGKKFKYKQLNQLLLENSNSAMEKQKEVLDVTIQKWKGSLEQVDDVCVIGIKI